MRDHFHIEFCDYNHNKRRGNGPSSLISCISSANTRSTEVSSDVISLYTYARTAALRRTIAAQFFTQAAPNRMGLIGMIISGRMSPISTEGGEHRNRAMAHRAMGFPDNKMGCRAVGTNNGGPGSGHTAPWGAP